VSSITGDGHRRRRARAVVHDQRGDNGRGRERQRAGDAEEGVSVQNSRNATGTRTVDARERNGRGDRGDDRDRRATRQKTVDVFRAQRHRWTGAV